VMERGANLILLKGPRKERPPLGRGGGGGSPNKYQKRTRSYLPQKGSIHTFLISNKNTKGSGAQYLAGEGGGGPTGRRKNPLPFRVVKEECQLPLRKRGRVGRIRWGKKERGK